MTRFFGNPASQSEPFLSIEDCAAKLLAADATMTPSESLAWTTLMSGSRRKVTLEEWQRQRRLFLIRGRGLQS